MENHLSKKTILMLLLPLLGYLFIITNTTSITATAQSKKQHVFQHQPTPFDYALAGANQLKTDWQKNKALRYIATRFAEVKEFERAIKVAESINDEVERAKTFSEIAVFIWQKGNVEKAKSMFSRARNFNRPTDKGNGMVLYAEKEVVSSIAIAYSKVGQYEIAFKIAEEINDDYEKLRTTQTILEAYVWDDKALISEEVLSRIIEVANDAMNNDLQRRILTCLLALAYSRAGDFESAEDLANQIGDEFDEQSVWYHYSKEFALGTFAEMLSEDNREDEAFRFVNSYKGHTQEKALLAMANVFVKQKRYELAEKTLNQLLNKEKTNFTSVIWASAAVIYKKLGNNQQCDALLRLAYENGVTAEDKTRKDYDLVFVAERAAEVGNYIQAIESLQTKRKFVVYDYMQAFGSVGAIAATERQFVTLDKIVNEIVQTQVTTSNKLKVRALTTIAKKLLDIKEKERASIILQTALVICGNDWDFDIEDLKEFAVTLARAEKHDLSIDVVLKIHGDSDQLVYILASLGMEFIRQGKVLDFEKQAKLHRLVTKKR